MKRQNLLLLFSIFLYITLGACSFDKRISDNQSASDVGSEKNMEEFSLQWYKTISRSRVVTYFGVDEENIELVEKPNSFGFKDFGFMWKKSNYEELKDQKINAILTHKSKDSATEQVNGSNEIYNVVSEYESPFGEVLVKNFRKYKDIKEAKQQFSLIHQNSKSNIDRALNYSKLTDKKAFEIPRDKYSKLTEIPGVGDEAYFDSSTHSLDIRYKDIAFMISIDSELDPSLNLEIAKEMAREILNELIL